MNQALLLVGAPGTGKGSLVGRLEAESGGRLVKFQAGEYFRRLVAEWTHPKAEEIRTIMSSGGIAPLGVLPGAMAAFLAGLDLARQIPVFDGMIPTPEYLEELAELWKAFSKIHIIMLTADPRESLRRLASRGIASSRPDDHPEVQALRVWLYRHSPEWGQSFHRRLAKPEGQFSFREVPTDGLGPEDVFAQVWPVVRQILE